MPEIQIPAFRVASRAALGSKTALRSAGISIAALPEGHVIHVLGEAGGPDLAPLLREVTGGRPHAVRTAGPAQWFLVGDEALSAAGVAAILAALPPGAAGVDQSHGRVRIRIEGPMVERVLAKGTAADLAPAAFPVGHSTTTLTGHIAAHLTRVAEDVFELMVLRTFAESLWDDLATMSGEYVLQAADRA
ncbi:sarcosine oxidase subunit gamma family protein [Pseudochelatococcus lubricantis]|uniref:sarcosine oxidase subunit gamma family protein n=1 Tax=Pseudochelatococcus lubricantis TaxID=1538102 RepID=UPI0035E62B27